MPEILSFDEIQKIREIISGYTYNSLRDKLLFELMYSSGISPKEVLSLGSINFDLENRTLHIITNKIKRELYFSKKTVEAYKIFMQYKEINFDSEAVDKVIFTNNSNERLTDRSLRRIFEKYFKRAGIQKEVSLYSLRHTFCVHIIAKGFKKEYLAMLLNINDEMLDMYEKIYKKEIACKNI